MTFETTRLMVFSFVSCFIGYIVGWTRNMWQIYKCFPDLYDELKRRCQE